MFQRTKVDFVNVTTSLHHFAAGTGAKTGIALGDPQAHQLLHNRLVSASSELRHTDLFPGVSPGILDYYAPGYARDVYWSRFLGLKRYQYATYPEQAWRNFLPMAAKLSVRVECQFAPELGWDVRPEPIVWIWPSGWATWISFVLRHKHTLEDVDAFVQRALTEQSLTVSGAAQPMTLRDLFGFIDSGVQQQFFGGAAAPAFSSSDETLIVVTVLERAYGTLPWKSLTPARQETMRRILRPEGVPSDRPFTKLVVPLSRLRVGRSDGLNNYVVIDDFGRFIWSDLLMRPIERNQSYLKCYHNTSVRAFVQAWHMLSLARVVLQEDSELTEPLRAALEGAMANLKSPKHINASSAALLRATETQETIAQVETLLKPAAKSQ
jgi:hypothetical protein